MVGNVTSQTDTADHKAFKVFETVLHLRAMPDPSGYHFTITNHWVTQYNTLTYTFRFILKYYVKMALLIYYKHKMFILSSLQQVFTDGM